MVKQKTRVVRKTYKYRLDPTDSQREQFHKFANITRGLWNLTVEVGKQCLDAGELIPPLMVSTKAKADGAPNLYGWLSDVKYTSEHCWLLDAPASILLSCVKSYSLSVKAAFDKNRPDSKLPKFHKKFKVDDSFTYHDGAQSKIDYYRKTIIMPKIEGPVKVRYSRQPQGKVKTITVIRKNKHWYVCLSCEVTITNLIHPSSSTVGIDRGVVVMAALSDGTNYNLPSSIIKLERKLSREQKNLSRKIKKSKNWIKNLNRIQLIYEKIANIRKDSLQKISTEISKNHADIVMEKLGTKKMTKAKGKYKSKSKLNRGILRQGWFSFQMMLGYKQHWNNGTVTLIDPHFTSQKCSCCGYSDPHNRTSQAKFKCIRCNYEQNADYNAACNIHAAGHAAKDCGGIGRKTPYEAITYYPTAYEPL